MKVTMMMSSPSMMFLTAVQVSLFLVGATPIEAFTSTSSRIQLLSKVLDRNAQAQAQAQAQQLLTNEKSKYKYKYNNARLHVRTHHILLNSSNNNNNSNDPIATLRDKFPFLAVGQKDNDEQQQQKGEEGEVEVDEDAYTKQQRKTKEVLSSLGIAWKEPEVAYVEEDNFFDIATASVPFALRLGSGAFVEGYKVGFKPKNNDGTEYIPYNVQFQLPITNNEYQLYETSTYNGVSSIDSTRRQPRGPIILYEFEACPFCRKVREAVSMLELDVEFRPCPKDTKTVKSINRQEMKGKFARKKRRITYPFMIDPNTGIEMFESDDIINYLFRAYGRTKDGDVPTSLDPNFFTSFMTGISLFPRFNKGLSVRDSKYVSSTMEPLVLWSAEGTPFGKLVREKLVELQICHVQVLCPRGSDNRQKLYEKTNCSTFQIPYLEDPNTGVGIFESAVIMEYLDKKYGVPPAKVEYL